MDIGYLLDVILSRLTIADVERLAEIQREGMYAAMNYGNSGQLETQDRQLSECRHIASKMLQSDRDNVERLILEYMRDNRKVREYIRN